MLVKFSCGVKGSGYGTWFLCVPRIQMAVLTKGIWSLTAGIWRWSLSSWGRQDQKILVDFFRLAINRTRFLIVSLPD